MMWPFSKRPRNLISVSDPALVEYFQIGPLNYSGVPVTETSALGLSAVARAVSLISQTIASLPLRSLEDQKDGTRKRIKTWLDNPGTDDGPTPFEWKEQILLYLLLHGDSPLAHIRNGAGALVGALPVHPLAVTPDWEKDAQGNETGRKVYTVTMANGSKRPYTQATMTQIMGPSLDGLRGVSPIWMARNSLGTAIAGDRAAANMFAKGALMAGLATADEDVDEDEAKVIKAHLDAKVSGLENAGTVPFINRRIKFEKWQMTNEDAQFLQSRQFSVEEVARWFGVPPHLLMQTEKQTSWGTGVAEQNRGLSRTVLAPWCARIEQRLSRLLPKTQFCEFDLAGLERGSPEQEIELLIKQVDAGLMTPNEARHIRNMPPIPGGDLLRIGAGRAALEVAA